MCIYCQNYQKTPDKWHDGMVLLLTSAKYTLIGDGKEYYVPLNFCPACGGAIHRDIDD